MPSTFADLGVPSDLVRALGAITVPFPVQTLTIPDALAGRDVCGKAPTGSGKTIAFAVPLAARTGRAQPRRPRSLVLAPTRELATQIADALRPLATARKRRVATFFGGVGFGPQLKNLRQGVDIVVACPGRLADLINQRALTLADVDFVVVDEADRMADMGFLPEVKRLLDQVAPNRQTLLFSATLDGAIDELVRNYQHDPIRHEVAPDEDAPVARHLFWDVDQAERIGVCAQIVPAAGPTMIFCRTRHGADRVAKQLGTRGVRSAAIHGGRSQGQRERALADFQAGRVDALVATDVAGRGIHVDGVGCVVHFDPPGEAKDYVHRSGRTARAGSGGVVVSLVERTQRKAAGALQRRLGLDNGTTPIAIDQLAEPVEATAGRPRLDIAQFATAAPAPHASARTNGPSRARNGGPSGGSSSSGPRTSSYPSRNARTNGHAAADRHRRPRPPRG